MQLVYLAYFDMWAVAIPLGVELALLVYLSGLWSYLEVFRGRGAKTARNPQDGGVTGDLENGNGPGSALGTCSAA